MWKYPWDIILFALPREKIILLLKILFIMVIGIAAGIVS